jgi:enoyl-CoA hydratase/carnithine racemase
MPDLLYEKHPEGHYALFTMNRPDRLNALGGTSGRDLTEALLDFNNDVEMRVGIMTGEGRAFSAGADLKEMTDRNARTAEIEARFESGQINAEERGRELAAGGGGAQVLGGPLSGSPKPVIAAVNGLAIGGGCERAMDCDIRIMSTEAYFGLFEVKRGILAGYAIHHASRLMPFSEAMYLLLTADRMSPEQALRIGFVHEVVEPDRLIPRAVEIAGMIAENAPLAIQGTKAMTQLWRQFAMQESQRLSTWVSKAVLSSDDAKEGPRAFAEKRAPAWTGR